MLKIADWNNWIKSAPCEWSQGCLHQGLKLSTQEPRDSFRRHRLKRHRRREARILRRTVHVVCNVCCTANKKKNLRQ